jgi:DNA-binding MarR family transcriptional regulator
MTGNLPNYPDHREDRMADDTLPLVETIRAVRRCFWLLASASDDLIADLGLTAAQRAVLEHLDEHGDSTAPQIAAEKSVKRQSIQELVDQLRDMGMVEVRDNPLHKRSVLIALSEAGRATFKTIRQREAVELKRVMSAMDTRALETSAKTLRALQDVLAALAVKGSNHDATS